MSSLIVDTCKILKVEKHPNADKLSIATVKGWSCIIGLNQYKQGDLVIFCPPDSVIPDNIIEKYNLEYLKKGGRVRTVKLRGFISQGLILDIPEGKNWKEGKDVAKELGIAKYESPKQRQSLNVSKATFGKLLKKYIEKKISLRRLIAKTLGLIKDSLKPKKNPNPLFNKYTDIENIKNYHTVFNEGDRVVILEKTHGTNARFGRLLKYKDTFMGKVLSFLFGKYEFVYGSHNVQLRLFHKKNFYGEDVYGKIAKKYNLAEIIPEDYIVYGEIYGKGIQELEYGMKDIDVVFFDVKYKGKYLNWCEVVEFCLYRNLPTVPIFAIENYKSDMLNKYTIGKSRLAFLKGNKEHIREGCVIKSLEEENHPRIGRKILKSINPEYLLKKNRTEFH